jgi:hypothetical protein
MDEIVSLPMNIHAAASYLVKFDARPDALFIPAEPRREDADVEPAQAGDSDPDPHVEDLETLRRDYDTRLSAALEARDRLHQDALDQARQEWASQSAEDLATRIEAGINGAFERLRVDVARVLAPFVSREVYETAVCDLVETLRRNMADLDRPAIRLEGPKDILARIGGALGEKQLGEVTMIEGEGIDVTLDLGATRLETCIEDWMKRLGERR